MDADHPRGGEVRVIRAVIRLEGERVVAHVTGVGGVDEGAVGIQHERAVLHIGLQYGVSELPSTSGQRKSTEDVSRVRSR